MKTEEAGDRLPPLGFFTAARRPPDSELMRAALAQRDSQLIAKVTVVTGAYT